MCVSAGQSGLDCVMLRLLDTRLVTLPLVMCFTHLLQRCVVARVDIHHSGVRPSAVEPLTLPQRRRPER